MSNSTDGSDPDALLESARTTLTQIGTDMIQSIVALCVESVLWAMYITLAFIASRILFQKRRTLLAGALLGTVWTMVCIDTAMYFIDINNAVKEVSYTLTSDLPLSLPERYALTDHLPWAAQTALYAFLCNLGDVIVIWRVHVFYSTSRHRWILYAPLLLLLGSFASGVISYCAAYSIATGSARLVGNFVRPSLCKNAQLASYVTTLATTGVATILIWFKAWEYRRTVSRAVWLPPSAKKSRIERTMLIIVESGVLYFLFFLHAVIEDSTRVGELEASSPSLAFANTIWVYMTSHLVGIYPVGVIILVHSQYAPEESLGTLTENVFPVAQGLGSTSISGSVQESEGRRRPRNVSISWPRPSVEVSVHKTEFVYGDDIPLEDVKGRATGAA